MKAIVHDRYGTPDRLELRDVPTPEPAAGQVSVRVHAASVNPLDGHMLSGTPMPLRLMAGVRRPKQIVRGADAAGVVEQIGEGVTAVAVGDRVVGVVRGSFAEVALAAEGALARIPDEMSFADAAALPVAGVTALQAVRDHARVQPGQRVLVNGAAGGVGTFTVQLAAAAGAEVTGVCSTRNVEMVRELGAADVIDYTTTDFVDGTRYDVIIDNVGSRSLSEYRQALTDDGVFVMVSGPKGRWIRPIDRMIAGQLRFAMGSQRFANFTASETGDELRALLGHIERDELRPVVDRHYSLVDTADAMRYLATGHARAKIIVDVLG
jgi:NADPH:quinone reductase-like Zn-dependent oxidoreductase